MPYIITTTSARGPVGDLSRMDSADAERALTWQRGQDVTRRAVATLDEARAWVEDRVYDVLGPEPTGCPDDRPLEFATDAHYLPESGGTVGPLPDGTVIQVDRTYGTGTDEPQRLEEFIVRGTLRRPND